MRRAQLPWYDHPGSSAALDRFWRCVREALRASGEYDVPERLTRGVDVRAQWRSPGLLLSQCCGPDLFTPAGADLVPIARPTFADLDVGAGRYFSHVVGRVPTDVHPRIVVNETSSRSGHGALREWLGAEGLHAGRVIVSGSHAASIVALRRGAAGLAAIDAHSWRWLDTRGLEVIGRSAAAPSPPWVMHRHAGVEPARMRAALVRAVEYCGDAIGIVSAETALRDDYERFEAVRFLAPESGSPPAALSEGAQ